MCIASIGGARYTEPSTWELGNSLTLMEFLVSDSDVAVISCSVFGPDKMRGSSLFPLQGGTLINVQSNSLLDPEEYVLLLWGGINTRTMTCTNELMKINISRNDKKKKRTHAGANKCESLNFVVDLTAFTAADRNKTSASLFSQGGIVPSPRAGHSFTKISVEGAILFGGVTLENRDKGVDSVFQQTCRDGRLYALNIEEHSWSSLIGEIPSRAYRNDSI